MAARCCDAIDSRARKRQAPRRHDASVHRHLRRSSAPRSRNGLQARGRGKRRQARRTRASNIFTVDDEVGAVQGTDNANKLVQRDKVDVLVGTVHSGVRDGDGQGRARQRYAADHSQRRRQRRDRRPVRAEYFPHVVLQLAAGAPDGQGACTTAAIRKVVTLTWKYGAGEESVESFKEAFTKPAARSSRKCTCRFPNVEFQPFSPKSLRSSPMRCSCSSPAAARSSSPRTTRRPASRTRSRCIGTGFLTDGTLDAQGASAQGLLTTLHYGDGIENPKNKQFR